MRIVSASEYAELMEDCGAPTYEPIATTVHKSRKDRVCAYCGTIKAGEYYERHACKIDGDFTVLVRHQGGGQCQDYERV